MTKCMQKVGPEFRRSLDLLIKKKCDGHRSAGHPKSRRRFQAAGPLDICTYIYIYIYTNTTGRPPPGSRNRWFTASWSAAAWFTGLLVHWSNGSWFACLLGYWFTGLLVYWFTGLWVHWFTGLLVYWFTGSLVDWFTGALVYWFPEPRNAAKIEPP